MDVELLLRVAGRFDRCINELMRLQVERAALLAVLTEWVSAVDAVADVTVNHELYGEAPEDAILRIWTAYEKARALVGERDTTDERGAVEGQEVGG